MNKKIKNLRKDDRVEVKIPLEIQPTHVFTESQIVNISKSGLFISSPRPLPIDCEIEFEFVLPRASKKIKAKGKVKWAIDQFSKPDGTKGIVPGMGVKFIKVSKESLKEILKYLKK